MRVGRVESAAKTRRRLPGLDGTRLVSVRLVDANGASSLVVADPLTTAVGDLVLISMGPSAGAALEDASPAAQAIDAVVVAVVNEATDS